MKMKLFLIILVLLSLTSATGGRASRRKHRTNSQEAKEALKIEESAKNSLNENDSSIKINQSASHGQEFIDSVAHKRVVKDQELMIGHDPQNAWISKSYTNNPHFEEEFDPDTVIKFDIEGGGEDTYYMHFNRAGTEVMGLFMVSAATFDIDPIISVYI
jgi:hypothetical protein